MQPRTVQHLQQLLRNVAEVDPEDTVANRASQLAVELELPHRYNTLTELDWALIRYAYSKRDIYVLEPGARHARVRAQQLIAAE